MKKDRDELMNLRRKINFIERSLMGIVVFFQDGFLNQEYAKKDGLLQRAPVLFKILSLLILLIVVTFLKAISPLFIILCFCLILSALSNINILFFIKRAWFFMPLFAVLIAIPSIFNIFMPGEPLIQFKILNAAFSITRQGLFGALVFVLRVTASVSLVVLTMLTTRQSELLSALKYLGIPVIFIEILNVCYLYIHILVKEIEDFYTALKSRRISYKDRTGRDIIGFRIAVFWEKARILSEEVHQAMLSRGYTGYTK